MPSSATGRPRVHRGFTLVELLVALAVMGLMVALVPMAYDRLRETTDYQGAVRALATEMRLARNLAMQSGQSQALTIDLHQRHIQLADRQPLSIPRRLQVEAEFARIEQTADRVGAIRFYPDGSSTGGSVSLIRPAGNGTRLRVDWLLGRVTQEPVAPS
ncbi:GspH/FimT family pseudopilin [Ectothiorhodospira magna]|uniref:GspH/FimT family pseudopilin n=1 Tax=Ectothiorhodospira magna TaxID=867345 RepID=UPI0013903FCE|nr:GspH/FimT family pseudopilin [Ectothiorhodospira magna]